MAKGNSPGGGGGGGSKKSTSSVPELSKDLIRRADANGVVYDPGTSIDNTYKQYAAEIQGMDLSEQEKRSSIKELHDLSEKALQAESRSRGAEIEGPARYNVRRGIQRADAASNARGQITSYMDNLRSAQQTKQREAANRRRNEALTKATASGALTAVIDGVTYRRARRNSRTWRPDEH